MSGAGERRAQPLAFIHTAIFSPPLVVVCSLLWSVLRLSFLHLDKLAARRVREKRFDFNI